MITWGVFFDPDASGDCYWSIEAYKGNWNALQQAFEITHYAIDTLGGCELGYGCASPPFPTYYPLPPGYFANMSCSNGVYSWSGGGVGESLNCSNWQSFYGPTYDTVTCSIGCMGGSAYAEVNSGTYCDKKSSTLTIS